MREIVALITNSNFTPSDADLTQVAKSVRSQAVNYAVDTGSVNALSITTALPIAAYTPGLPIRVKAANENTGASTINVSGLGAVAIVRCNGAALSAGDIQAGAILDLLFDGVRFQIANFQGLSAGSTTYNNYNINIPYCDDTSTVANLVTAIFSPVIGALTEGLFVAVKIAHTVSGPTQITVNANSAVAITHPDGSALLSGDVTTNGIMLLCYDGTKFQLLSATANAPNASTTLRMLEATIPFGYNQVCPRNTVILVTCISQLMSNTLVTSTWDGYGVLTIGAGEDGLWAFDLWLGFGDMAGYSAPYASIMRTRGGVQKTLTQGYTQGAGAYQDVYTGTTSCTIDLQVGDIITFYAAIWSSQSSGSLTGDGASYPTLRAYRIEGLH